MEAIQFSNKLAIVGAGGLGREIESWLSDSTFIQKYRLIGYLDDNLNSLDKFESDYKVVDSISLQTLRESKNVIVAISNFEVRKEIFKYCKKNGGFNILNFFHKSSVIGKYNKIGLGLVAAPNTIVSCNISIGEGVLINSGSQIGHDAKIGNYVSIMANVDIGGGAEIGDNVFIGSGAKILPYTKIVSNARIGAGSIVIRDVKRKGTYFGNPAKKIF